ncbi:MAG TPA: DUF1674 domain-containing protein [Dokdonella sp.]|nr:DUF1674 domain-containing protein [Dokdonella sp.]
MSKPKPDPEAITAPPDQTGPAEVPCAKEVPREIGGRDGPDPTRFGDWEKNGRCIDF